MKYKKKLKIGFSVGEVSGDFNASLLYSKLKEVAEKNSIYMEAFGLGGRFLREEGVNIFADLTHRSSIGVFESIPYAFDRIKIAKNFIRKVKNEKPDIFIFVDNQGFNIPLSKAIKDVDKSIKTVYYFPPHISIWGQWNGRKLQKYIDYFITPFYNDYLEYKKFNDKNVYFFGHPFFDNEYIESKLAEKPQIIYNTTNIKDSLIIDYSKNLNSNFDCVFLMPGSRNQEINNLFKIFLEVADKIYNKFNLISIVPLSNEKFLSKIIKFIGKRKNIIVISKNNYSLLKNSKFCIMSSGTATLEALILNVPMAICYKISPITFFIGKFLVNTKWVGMANILANKEIGKEFLQKDCNSNSIYSYVEQYLENKELYYNLKREKLDIFNKLKEKYGGNVIDKTANFLISLV
ncbi:MAG: lipid-A-disaccharide synthase [Spirochaetes bacterium]|nr:lipid-A-disaccharide synthase [Spirochaetota bacterium]